MNEEPLFKKITNNVSTHQSLPDNPNLSPQDLKKEWDKAAEIIRDNFNEQVDVLNANVLRWEVVDEWED